MGAKGLLIVTAQVIHLADNETYPVDIPIALIGQASKDILMVIVLISLLLETQIYVKYFVLGIGG